MTAPEPITPGGLRNLTISPGIRPDTRSYVRVGGETYLVECGHVEDWETGKVIILEVEPKE